MRAVREDGRTPLRSRRDPFWLNACRQTFLQLRQARCGMYLKGGTQLMRLSYSQQAFVGGGEPAFSVRLQQPQPKKLEANLPPDGAGMNERSCHEHQSSQM